MGRKKKAKVDKSVSATFSFSPKHTFMLQTIMDIFKKTKSEVVQDLVEDYYNKNCGQGKIDVR